MDTKPSPLEPKPGGDFEPLSTSIVQIRAIGTKAACERIHGIFLNLGYTLSGLQPERQSGLWRMFLVGPASGGDKS